MDNQLKNYVDIHYYNTILKRIFVSICRAICHFSSNKRIFMISFSSVSYCTYKKLEFNFNSQNNKLLKIQIYK